jgi:hypothetical protein
LERFLALLAHVESEQLAVMVAAWEAAKVEPRRAAWREATQRLKDAGRDGEVGALREAVTAWSRDQAFDVMALFGGQSLEWDRNRWRAAATAPILDAGLAAIAADLLDEGERDVLRGPWDEAMGRPGPGSAT